MKTIQLNKPMIIDFEGIDGTFKNTNACKLQDYIEDNYTSNVIVVSFPNYGGESSYLLREYFSNNIKKQELSEEMVSNLFMLDMYDSYYKEIEKFYKKNYIIIFDRYWYSNIYYQGTKRSVSDCVSNSAAATDKERLVNFKEPIYREFEDIINNINEKNFKLPKANLIYKMIHNLVPSRTIIEQRREIDESHNDQINESKYEYLDMVNLFLNKYPFRYGDKNYFNQYIINLDKDESSCKSEDEIFNNIKSIFDDNIKKFIAESEWLKLITRRDMKYFNIAKEVSKTSKVKRIHIGAVLVISSDNIYVSTNIKKSHPLQKKLNKLRFTDTKSETCKNSLHAEMNTLLKVRYLDYDLSRAKLYVYREDSKGNLAMCRPCNACMAQIRAVGIKQIYYTTPDGFCEEHIDYYDK